MNLEILSIIIAFVVGLLVPVISYLYKMGIEIAKIKIELKNILNFQNEYKQDVKLLFKKLDSLKDLFHSKSEEYVRKKDYIPDK
jgi:hypothetical protein